MKEDTRRIVEELFGLGEDDARSVLEEVGVGVEAKKETAEVPAEQQEVEEQFDLEPVIKPQEAEEEDVPASGADEMMKAKEQGVDPVIEILKAMKPEERAAWAAKEGPEAVLKLMQFQQMELEQRIEQVGLEQKRTMLDSVIQKWASANTDILEDPLIGNLAEGLDMALLKKAGYSSYLELTPAQLEAHLSQVAEIMRKMKAAGVSGEILKNEMKGGDVSEKEGKVDTEPKSEKAPVHLGDLGAGGEPIDVSTEVLAKMATDPMKFEEAISKIPEKKLAEMLAGL